jgi:hypothetical protein
VPSESDRPGPCDLTILIAVVMAQWVALLGMGLLVVGTYHEINRLEKDLRSIPWMPAPSRLQNGELIPVDFGRPLPPRTFLLAVSNGCSGCIDISAKLGELGGLDGWSLFVLFRGKPPGEQSTNGHSHPMKLPAYAEVFYEQHKNEWFKQLGVTSTPTAIAVVGGRVIDQVVAPRLDWFTTIDERRRGKAEVLLYKETAAKR